MKMLNIYIVAVTERNRKNVNMAEFAYANEQIIELRAFNCVSFSLYRRQSFAIIYVPYFKG